MSTWQAVLLEPAKVILSQIGQFLVRVVGVLLILLIGWLLAKILKTVVTKTLKALKVDQIADRIELDTLLEKGGITYAVSELLGVIAYWLAILLTFMIAVDTIGLTVAADLLNNVVNYIPNVVSAIFILILGIFVATLLRNIVQTAANNVGISQSKILSKIVEVAIIAFAVIMSLEQLNIGIRITELTLAIIMGSIGLGLSLAFGLGCKDIAGRAVADLMEKLKKK